MCLTDVDSCSACVCFGVQGYQGANKGYWVCRKKMQTSAEALTRLSHNAFYTFTDSVVNLKFEEEPNYAYYIGLFEPIVNTPDRPLQIDTALRAIVSDELQPCMHTHVA